eukprot:4528253-Amphidinium_carterae.1
MLVKMVLDSSDLPPEYWNYAIEHAVDLPRDRALKVTYPHPTVAEMIGIWTLQHKHNKAKCLDPHGSVGGFLMCDTWWTGVTHVLVKDEGGEESIALQKLLLESLLSLWNYAERYKPKRNQSPPRK